MGVNLRGLGLYAEDLSRPVRHSPKGEGGRDSVKVDDMSRQLTALAAKLSAL